MTDPALDTPIDRLHDLIARGDPAEILAYLSPFHPSDLADLLEELDEEERGTVLRALSDVPALAAEALAEMEWDEHPAESLAALEPEQIASLVAELSDDDAADIIGELEPADRDRVLASLPLDDAGEIRELLRYHEESAGGLMTTELVSVPDSLTAAEALEEVRRQGREIGEFYNIWVVDDGGRLRGTLPLRTLVTAQPGALIRDMVEPVVATVHATMDQEEVGRILSRYNLVAVPVVDRDGCLLGRITFDDVIDVIEAETTEDMLKFAGASEEEEIRGDWWDAARSRLPWLLVYLVTASLGAGVVLYFREAFASLPVLAAIMPIIAGTGGNTGTQALAVTIRRLALSQESVSRRWGIVGKELLVGLGNGLAIGAVVGLATAGLSLLWDGGAELGLVVMLAMWMNLAVAGFAGAFVPIILERFRVDPAVASSIFVTTLTDFFGFLLLLGLASRMLL